MSTPYDPLFSRAFARAPAAQANSAIQSARESQGDQARSFEMVLPEGADLRWLERELLPRLVYHLESLGIRPPVYPGVFLSLFAGEDLLFIAVRELMAFSSEALGLTADQMYERWGTGERRTPVRPVLALPAGEAAD